MEVYLGTSQLFSVPTTVADHLLGIASHDQLKILLYILAHSNQKLSDTDIARACKVRAEAVEEALVFWQSVNVLQNDAPPTICHVTAQTPAQPSPAAFQASSAAPKTEPSSVTAPPAAVSDSSESVEANVQTTSSGFHLLPSEIAARKQENPAIAAMLTAAEQRVGHPLIHTELRSIFWMHEYLGLAPDLIFMIVAYCVEIERFSVRYMETIAVEWCKRGILTHELAVEDIEFRTASRSFTRKIMRIFEMKRRPTPKQQDYIDKWQQMNLSPELVEYAYHKTRDNANDQLSFPYLHKILQAWHTEGIRTVAEASAADAAYHEAKRKVPEPQQTPRKGTKEPYQPAAHSYDLNEIEALMKKI